MSLPPKLCQIYLIREEEALSFFVETELNVHMFELAQVLHVGRLFHEYHRLVAIDVVVGVVSDL